MYSLNHEMTLTPVDYLLRRTNYLLFISDQLDRIKEPIIQKMSAFYGWDETETTSYREELEQAINESQLTELKKER